MAIYTKKGDSGQTSLIDGTRVSKSSAIPQAIGTIDELNSNLGMAKALLKIEQGDNTPDTDRLSIIQEDLFCIGSYLAGKKDILTHLEEHVLDFESTIDRLTLNLPELKNFILPSGSTVSVQFQICRAVCRRAERCVVEVEENETILKYLNRLSDLLFMFARMCNYSMGEKEHLWKNKEEVVEEILPS